MTPFQKQWIEIGHRFQLIVRTDVALVFGDESLLVPVVLENFGAVRGMVLVTEYAVIDRFTERLIAAGFGYSCLSEPTNREVDEVIDDASTIDMLRDWSWSGPGSPPGWYVAWPAVADR
jgi:hypothetical protein